MGVEAVHYVEIFRIFRRLLRKVGGTAAAQKQYIDLICHLHRILCRIYRHARCLDVQALRISSGKYCHKLHVCILPDGTLNASSEISVTHNS